MSGIYGYVNTVARKLRAGLSSGACETFAVIANWPNRARPVPAYFKVSTPDVQQKLILNELLANRIAVLRNLPVPEACPCACRKEFLRDKGAGNCLTGRDDSPFIAGIATLDANPHHVKQGVFPGPKLEHELLKWRHCAELSVFDELLWNVDRTYQNLLRIGSGDYVIIDHDRVLGGANWTPESLVEMMKQPSNANQLADLIVRSQDQVTLYRMLKIAEEYAKKFQIPEALANTLAIQARIDHALARLIIDLLNHRIKNLPALLASYVRKQQLELLHQDE